MDKLFVCPTVAQDTPEKTPVHMCEQKRRALQKNEKHVQLGYYAPRFYTLCSK